MAQQITLRRGLSTEWSAVGTSLILAAGEPGFETDTGKLKIGDGISVWNTLEYVNPEITAISTLADLTDVSDIPADINQVLRWSGTEWIPSDLPEDNDTTYGLSIETSVGPNSADIRLTDSNLNVDNITLSGGDNITITQVDQNQLTISAAFFDTNNTSFTGTTNVETLNASTKVVAETVESINPLKLVTSGNVSVRASQGTIFGSFDAGINGKISQVFNSYESQAFLISQAHGTPDSANFEWRKSRGTIGVPTSVAAGDTLGDIVFLGHDGTGFVSGAAIRAVVESTPTSSVVPTKIVFAAKDEIVGNKFVAEITSASVLKVNKISALTANGNLEILNNGSGKVQLPAGTTVGGVPIGTISIVGSVADSTLLPTPVPAVGTAYVVESPTPAHLWASDGTIWVDLGAFQGPVGADGEDGVGVPIGGTTGQVLAKSSDTDYATTWITPFSGAYGDLSGTPLLATVATSGSYDDLADTPTSITSFGITDGTNGQVLTTDGAGNFSFTNVSTVGALNDLTDVIISGTPSNGQVLKYDGSNWVNGTDSTSTIFTRQSISGTSSSLPNGSEGPINITGYKSYALLKIETSAAAWVRIYTSEAARQADNARLEGEDPLPGSGVIAEVITSGAETIVVSPATIGFNDESPVTNNIPIRVTNKSGNTVAITVTLTAIQLEA